MIRKTVKVLNRAGIHARPATLIAQLAISFNSKITFIKETMQVNAKSIMGVMGMGAGYGSELILEIDGVDELLAAESLEKLFLNRFEET